MLEKGKVLDCSLNCSLGSPSSHPQISKLWQRSAWPIRLVCITYTSDLLNEKCISGDALVSIVIIPHSVATTSSCGHSIRKIIRWSKFTLHSAVHVNLCLTPVVHAMRCVYFSIIFTESKLCYGKCRPYKVIAHCNAYYNSQFGNIGV